MSLNKTNNYSIIDIDKSCNKSTASQDQPSISSIKRYNVKKMPELKKSHTNQNNTLHGDPSHHRYLNSSDTFLRNRYKSYDYLPARRPNVNQHKSNLYYQDMCNEYSDSAGDNNETSHEAHQKFRKSYSFGGHKHFSSNEDLDNSCIYEDINHSSGSSIRYPCRFGNFKDNHDDYHRKSRHAEFENTKYPGDLWNYENLPNYSEMQKYRKYSPTATFTRSPDESRSKHSIRGSNYPSYINNNRSDPTLRKSHKNRLSTDFYSSRLIDFNNDNYSINRKETPNRNMLSLKSTYRKNENIPHSGTRLENHRKQIDKYCTNRSRETRFNESNNCGDIRHQNSVNVNRLSKNFRSHLPPPKYSAIRKKYGEARNPENNKYVREYFTIPQRSKMFTNEHVSDNESCYFENYYNTNNECTSKHKKGTKITNNEYCPSISDDFSSSSLVVSQEKPTERDSFGVLPIQTTKCSHSKEPNIHRRHSQRSTSHRNTSKHH